MQSLIDTMTARPLLAVAAAVVIAGLAESAASADRRRRRSARPVTALWRKRGAFTPIDHPRATTVAAVPSGQAGTATLGINDRGQVLGAYERRDGIIRTFVRDRKGRFTAIAAARSLPPGQFDEYVDINNRDEIVGFYNDDQGATTTGFLRQSEGGSSTRRSAELSPETVALVPLAPHSTGPIRVPEEPRTNEGPSSVRPYATTPDAIAANDLRAGTRETWEARAASQALQPFNEGIAGSIAFVRGDPVRDTGKDPEEIPLNECLTSSLGLQ